MLVLVLSMLLIFPLLVMLIMLLSCCLLSEVNDCHDLQWIVPENGVKDRS